MEKHITCKGIRSQTRVHIQARPPHATATSTRVGARSSGPEVRGPRSCGPDSCGTGMLKNILHHFTKKVSDMRSHTCKTSTCHFTKLLGTAHLGPEVRGPIRQAQV